MGSKWHFAALSSHQPRAPQQAGPTKPPAYLPWHETWGLRSAKILLQLEGADSGLYYVAFSPHLLKNVRIF